MIWSATAKRNRRRRALRRWAQPQKGAWRLRAWASLLFADHGIIRPVYWNSGRIMDGIWRGPQPNPLHIKRLAQRGFKTIVNLRGQTPYGSYALEKRAARKYGIVHIDLPLHSGTPPDRAALHALQDICGTMAKPALIHCKSGADRTSFAAAALLLMNGAPLNEAMSHMSLRYGHLKSGRSGILDAFFSQYASDTKDAPMPFMRWVDEVYDPEKLKGAFRQTGIRRWLTDALLRRE